MSGRRANTNLRAIAEELGLEYRTAHSWRERGLIPDGDLDARGRRRLADLVALRRLVGLGTLELIASVIDDVAPAYPRRVRVAPAVDVYLPRR